MGFYKASSPEKTTSEKTLQKRESLKRLLNQISELLGDDQEGWEEVGKVAKKHKKSEVEIKTEVKR